MSQNRVLFVDDVENVLSAIKRQFRNIYDVEVAQSGKEGLHKLVEQGPFGVVVTDMKMPEMNGVQFLQYARKVAPDTVGLMLTGNADQKTAQDAVNQGAAFRFLTKPCSQEVLQNALDAAFNQHKLIASERELLEGTLNGSINLLSEILSLALPEAFGFDAQLQKLAKQCAPSFGIADSWNLEMAVLFSNIGYVTLPPSIRTRVESGDRLSESEQDMIDRIPEISARLLEKIPRLEAVAKAVRYQSKNHDGSGIPEDDISGTEIPIESRILRVIRDIKPILADGKSLPSAIGLISANSSCYDASVFKILQETLAGLAPSLEEDSIDSIEVKISQLRTGQTLAEDLISEEGSLVYPKGRELTATVIERLQNFSRANHLPSKIQILCNRPE